MKISFAYSIFYVMSALILLSGFYFFPKSKQSLNGIVWVPLSIITFLCSNAFFTAIINLVSIPINLISMGCVNLILALALWFYIFKKRCIQKHYYKIFDLIAFIVIVGVAVFFGLLQFGANLQIHYETSDPSVHMQMAMDVVNNQSVVTGMLFAPVNNALFISVFAPFTTLLHYFKLFILSDFIMFALSGLMFYAAIRQFSKNNFMKICGIGMTILYMLGYPLNNMVFGFVYLGIGVTIIAFIGIMSQFFIEDKLNKYFNIVLLMLGAYSIVVCYSLFAPVVYVALFLSVAYYYWKKQKLFQIKTVLVFLAIFLVPVILGLYYAYFSSFIGVSPSSAISLEGYIYKDLFSNFVPVLPFALYGFIKIIRKKELSFPSFLLILMAVFMVTLLVMGMYGKVSSYYYYKTYYPMWFVVFYLCQKGIYHLQKLSKSILICYALTWGFIAGMGLTHLDAKIRERNVQFNPVAKSDSFFDVYYFNKLKIKDVNYYSDDLLDAYNYLINHCNVTENEVPYVDSWQHVYWYEAITNQRVSDYYYWIVNPEDLLVKMKQDSEYILVNKENEFTIEHSVYFDSLERIYENNTCYIVKTK